MEFLNPVPQITALQRDSIKRWKQENVQLKETDFLRLVEENHAFNYQLWLAEDRARRDDKGYEFVYHAKREIDHCNQQRNNRMEAMDAWLYTFLQPTTATTCPVHSESPGMMIDRLSILSLKEYHMQLQVTRQEVDDNHRLMCDKKLQTIQTQHAQLTTCLQNLIDEIIRKTRTFRIYHQFKMYNDPTLNPELYRKAQ